MAEPALKRTPLHDIHVSLGAKMVPFGGYEMPVSYADGIAAEHKAVRETVGVFDVSHMGEFEVTGPDRNAFNIPRDWEHVVEQKRGANVRLRNVSDETGLLAVQGPKAEALLAPLTPVGIAMIPYYHFAEGKVAGVQCFISRTGYTGEDGFELYCRAGDLETLWHALVGAGRAEPCGLGARDTLRLEAGYPLYGNDIDDTVTPYEAGLGWIVKLEKGADFTGLAALKRQKLAGVTRRLVGFQVAAPRTVARHGYGVYVDGAQVDVVRSGTVTPTANWAIGITYLPVESVQPGARFDIDVRGKRAPAEVARLPFVARRTKK